MKSNPARLIAASSILLLVLAGAPSRASSPRSEEPGNLGDLARNFAGRLVSLEVDREPEPRNERFERQLRALGGSNGRGLREYFRRPEGPVTGLLLDREGHVLTSNYNVLGELKSIHVTLADGTRLAAELKARDTIDDLALLKLEEPPPEELPLPELRWGSTDSSLQAGTFTLALGCTREPGQATATLGIVSAPARNVGRAFQTDAPLNYGNSGGPILNLEGEVIGVGAFIGHVYPQWGFNSGIGFGVRADTILGVLPELEKGNDLEDLDRPLLGVRAARRPARRGARIEFVQPGSGAAKGGLKAEDVIVEFDGATVEDFTHLRHLIFKKAPGDEISLTVRREDREIEMDVTLGTFGP